MKTDKRTLGDRARDAVLALVAIAMAAQFLPGVFAAWDATKPANNSALVSSEIRANWTSIQNAIGNPDTVPLQLAGAPTFKPGGSSTFDATTSGRIASDFTTHTSNASGAETDLASLVMNANTLNADGKALRITAWGTIANNTNTTTIKFYFGATPFTVEIAAHGAAAGIAWFANIVVIRTGASAERMAGSLTQGAAGSTNWYSAFQGTAAIALNANVTLKFTGASSVASADVTQEGMIVEVIG
jgi:hypothetical protein